MTRLSYLKFTFLFFFIVGNGHGSTILDENIFTNDGYLMKNGDHEELICTVTCIKTYPNPSTSPPTSPCDHGSTTTTKIPCPLDKTTTTTTTTLPPPTTNVPSTLTTPPTTTILTTLLINSTLPPTTTTPQATNPTITTNTTTAIPSTTTTYTLTLPTTTLVPSPATNTSTLPLSTPPSTPATTQTSILDVCANGLCPTGFTCGAGNLCYAT